VFGIHTKVNCELAPKHEMIKYKMTYNINAIDIFSDSDKENTIFDFDLFCY